jgi:hypothetical protein
LPTNLGNFVVDAVGGGVAESVSADDSAAVDDDAIAQNAVIVDDDIGIEDAVAADFCLGANVDAGVDDGAGADGCGGIDVGFGVDTGVQVRALAMQGDHCFLVGEGWVLGPQKRQVFHLYFLIDDNGGRFGGGQMLFVFGIGKETDLAGLGIFQCVYGGDAQTWVAADKFGADQFG